jgi:4-alpha-glucanotransferase
MKVLQFGFGDPGAHIYLPQNFEPNCVVYTGTHDNDTTAGWWKSSASRDERRYAATYFGEPADGMHWAFIRAALGSVARLAIVPLQDFLGLGSEARMNTPSLIDGNWGWRFAKKALTPSLAEKLATLSSISDRNPQTLRADQKGDGEMREDFAA